jgi:hypothetical protein
MGKPKRRHPTADEQHVLEHAQVRLLTTPNDVTRCDQLIIEHHCLRDATLVGEHLRYAFVCKGRWLGVAAWSGAAFHIKDRDAFIGRDGGPAALHAHGSGNPQPYRSPTPGIARVPSGAGLGYPIAGMVCLMVMAMATGVRKGPTIWLTMPTHSRSPSCGRCALGRTSARVCIAAPSAPPSFGCWPECMARRWSTSLCGRRAVS